MPHEVRIITTKQGIAYVIDSTLDEITLRWIDEFRLSLPLDSKRPTVNRRFFADGPLQGNTDLSLTVNIKLHTDRPMANLLEVAIQKVISEFQNGPRLCHVFRYQRFLEYTQPGSKLDPHTDGTKICDDTHVTSTHTLLLYLTDCECGGETLLMTECTKDMPTKSADGDSFFNYCDPVLYATQPRRGRILLFPHATPHAGAFVESVPKICLRAEVCLSP